MAKAVHGNGCVVYEQTRVSNVHDSSEQCKVECGPNASVKAKHVIMATHTPIGLHVTMHTAVFPMRSYVMAVRVSENLPAALFWDTAEVDTRQT
jgi:glycine/D-amino acid oxidase-like deaminating enzyme